MSIYDFCVSHFDKDLSFFCKQLHVSLCDHFLYSIAIPDEPVLERMSSMQHYRETIGKIKAGPMLPETKTLLKMLFQPYVIELARFLSDDRYLFRDTNFG